MDKLEETASRLLETVPPVMRCIRGEMRLHRGHDLSVPQFRSLSFVKRSPEASLSDLAEHLGLTLPAASKIVEGLVSQKLVTRRDSKEDRRRMMLSLTREGEEILRKARSATLDYLKEALRELSAEEVGTVLRAMSLLQPLFAAGVKEGKQYVAAYS